MTSYSKHAAAIKLEEQQKILLDDANMFLKANCSKSVNSHHAAITCSDKSIDKDHLDEQSHLDEKSHFDNNAQQSNIDHNIDKDRDQLEQVQRFRWWMTLGSEAQGTALRDLAFEAADDANGLRELLQIYRVLLNQPNYEFLLPTRWHNHFMRFMLTGELILPRVIHGPRFPGNVECFP